ncbi:MAG: chemotaxis protein CheA [Candidatus Hinthialibacter antarcticus]|nr:chemotaxis protein CheA [Candidatus Hinthialibacter antarcticus]
MSEIIDQASIEEFANESMEHLDDIEPDLMSLEGNLDSTSPDTINKIFRAIHSIKGGAGFMPAEPLKQLSHKMEQALIPVRDGERPLTSDLLDLLLQGIDRLREMLNAMLNGDVACSAIDCTIELERLESLENQSDKTAAADDQSAAPQTTTLQCDRLAVEEAVNQGQLLYELTLPADHFEPQNLSSFLDVLITMGEVIASDFDVAQSSELERLPTDYKLLYATVLDPEMTEAAVDLPSGCVRQMTIETLFAAPEVSQKKQESAIIQKQEAPASDQTESVTKTAPSQSNSQASKSSEPQNIRVHLSVLNQIMNMVGELVLVRNRLLQTLDEHKKKVDGLEPLLKNLDFITSEIQESFMQTRMQPIGSSFSRFRRLIRDLSKQFGKPIQFETSGDEVELDRTVLELLTDPLVHILRNSADHGIEPPEVRLQQGKAEQANIGIHVEQRCGKIYINIVDDGKGIDPEVIRKKAVEKKLVSSEEAERLPTKELVRLIFAPGFSTASKITQVSGRGVGMDVVRHNIEKLGGAIDIDTVKGGGTTIQLALPQNVSIMSALIVETGRQRFAIPYINLVELVVLESDDIAQCIYQINNDLVLRLRESLYPLVSLSDLIDAPRMYWDNSETQWLPDRRQTWVDSRQEINLPLDYSMSVFRTLRDKHKNRRRNIETNQAAILIVRDGDRQYGILIDQIVDTEEIVVKSLSSYARSSALFSGASILGDGSVILILDISGLSHHAHLKFDEIEPYRNITTKETSIVQQAQVPSLVFCVDPDEYFAIGFEHIIRIEPVFRESIQQIGEHEFVPFREDGLPVFRLENDCPIRPLPSNQNELFAIIIRPQPNNQNASQRFGLLASTIINHAALPAELKPPCTPAPGILGTCLWNEKLIQMVDPYSMLQATGGPRP